MYNYGSGFLLMLKSIIQFLKKVIKNDMKLAGVSESNAENQDLLFHYIIPRIKYSDIIGSKKVHNIFLIKKVRVVQYF